MSWPARAMAPVKEELAGEPDRTAEFLQDAGVPVFRPEVGAHLGRDCVAEVAHALRLVEHDVDVVVLSSAPLAVDALSLAHVGVMGIKDEADEPDEGPFSDRVPVA